MIPGTTFTTILKALDNKIFLKRDGVKLENVENTYGFPYLIPSRLFVSQVDLNQTTLLPTFVCVMCCASVTAVSVFIIYILG